MEMMYTSVEHFKALLRLMLVKEYKARELGDASTFH